MLASKKISMYILISILVIMVGLFGLVRYLEAAGVFFASRTMENHPGQFGLTYEDLYFKTPDGLTLNAWLVKKEGAKATLFFAHGNAGNISDRLMKLRFFHELGLNVFIFDYRGYGKSTGKPSEKGVYLDAQAAYDYLKSRGDIDMDHVVVYGASLGGAVAIDLASQRPLAALVIDSSLTSAKDMAKILYPYLPSFLMSIKFDSISKVKSLTMPKLIMHSPEDKVVPFWMGQRLFEAAGEPKQFLQVSGGHNDAQIVTDPKTAPEFVAFLKRNGLL